MAWSLSERDRPEPEPLEGKLFEKELDDLGEWFSNTGYGKRFLEDQQRNRELDQQLIDQGGPAALALKIRNTPNPVEQRILKGISDVTNIDERVTTPATYIGLSAGIRGLSNVKFPRTYSKLTQKRILPKEERRMINITKDVDEIFNAPADIIRKAKVIYRHHPDAGWTAAINSARQLPKYAANAKIYLGDQPPTSTFMTTTGGQYTPPPAWTRGLTESQIAVEKQLYLDQFAEASLLPDGTLDTTNPLVYKPEVKISPRGVPISKRRESAYKFQGDLAAEWNTWSDDTQFIDELSDYPKTAFVEHLVGKGDRLNWFWNLPNEVRFRKGSRHGPDNTRIFYSDRQKKLKDATENILYNMQDGMNPMDRLIVEYDIPKMEGKSITVRQPAGDVILRKVNGTEVGRLGDYFDVLYAPTEDLVKGLTTNINPRTGKFYIDPNTGDMKRAIRKWREKIITDKINKIIDEAPNLKGKTPAEIYQQKAGEIIDKDMAAFRKEYDFISKPKGNTLIDEDMIRKELDYQAATGTTPEINILQLADQLQETDTVGYAALMYKIETNATAKDIQKKYPQLKPKVLNKIKQLTPSEIESVQRAYGISGKGSINQEGKLENLIHKIIDLREPKWW